MSNLEQEKEPSIEPITQALREAQRECIELSMDGTLSDITAQLVNIDIANAIMKLSVNLEKTNRD